MRTSTNENLVSQNHYYQNHLISNNLLFFFLRYGSSSGCQAPEAPWHGNAKARGAPVEPTCSKCGKHRWKIQWLELFALHRCNDYGKLLKSKTMNSQNHPIAELWEPPFNGLCICVLPTHWTWIPQTYNIFSFGLGVCYVSRVLAFRPPLALYFLCVCEAAGRFSSKIRQFPWLGAL